MTPILILAAGRSSRMGEIDKLSLAVEGVPLLRGRALAAVATGEPVYVALPAPEHPRADLVKDLPVTQVFATDASLGLGHTLQAAVAALPACNRFMIVLADMPDVTTADLLTVLAGPALHPVALIWRGATAGGKPGHPVLFATQLRPAFASLVGDVGAEPIIRANQDRTVLVALPGNHASRDLDTPEDWATIREQEGR